jgi:hypothetical protein
MFAVSKNYTFDGMALRIPTPGYILPVNLLFYRWGYFSAFSSTPRSVRPVGSRLITLDEASMKCKLAFNLTTKDVDVDSINRHGGFNISYPRLAFIDGEQDPWRWAGVHAPGLPARQDTLSEPYMLIQGGIHHCKRTWSKRLLLTSQGTRMAYSRTKRPKTCRLDR